MIYLDTSALLPLFVPEPSSSRVERWFVAHADASLGISDWTVTEFSSALGVKVRARVLTREAARAARTLLDTSARDCFTVIHGDPDDFALANEFLSDPDAGLRAGEALHLAIARHHGATSVVSLDRSFVAAGRRLALPTALLS